MSEQSHSRQRIIWLDICKGIGMILVLIGHIYRNDTVFNWLYSFHMPLFFFAAGYLYKEKGIVDDIKHRLRTVVVPYFFLGSLVLIYWILIERRFRDSSMSPVQALCGFLLGENHLLDFNVHLWFLPCFFVTVVIYNILRRCFGKKVTYGIVIFFSLLYSFESVMNYRIPYLPWGIDRMFWFIGFYTAGSILKETGYIDRIIEKSNRSCWFIGLMALVVNLLIALFFGRSGSIWFINGLIGIVGVLLVSIAISRSFRVVILQQISRASLVIMCLHGPVYRIIIKCISMVVHLDTEVVRANILLAFLTIILTMAVCLIMYYTLNRFLPLSIGSNRKQTKPAA